MQLVHPILASLDLMLLAAFAVAKRTAVVVLIASGLLSASGCSDREFAKQRTGDDNLSGVVKISGSNTMAPLIAEMAREFQALHPGVRVDVRAETTGRGVSDVREGKSDIAMVSRVMSSEEHDLLPFLIARDGLCLAVNRDNPISSLTREQAASLFTKEARNWRDVGGADMAVHALGTSLAAGATELMLSYLRIERSRMRADVVDDSSASRFKTIAANPRAIMYGSLGAAERRHAAGENIKLLPIDGISASSENVAAGRYQLARPLALATNGLPSGAVKAFIDFARSAEVSPLIKRYEFVSYRD